MRAPASLVAIPLLTGLALGLRCFETHNLAVLATGGAVVALIAGIAAVANRSDAECVAAIVLGGLFAGLSLGTDAAARAYAPTLLQWFAHRPDAGPAVLAGVLREDAAPGPFGVSLLLDVSHVESSGSAGSLARAKGGIRVTVAGSLAASRLAEWTAGRGVRVTATLREPAVYLNPGAVDTRASLARRGVILVGSIKSAALVVVTARGSTLDEAAAATRAWTRSRLQEFVGRWGRRSAAIATAILIGDRTGLPDEDERRLQEAGTYHVIAISGGNIAILTVFLLAAARLIGIGQRAAAVAVIAALLFYGQLAGLSGSVQRAVMAAITYLLGRLIDQKGSTINILAAVAIAAVAESPLAIVDPGFLLSFGATLGILMIVPVLQATAQPIRWRTVRAVLEVLFATVAAEVALAPIAALLFSRVTFAGLFLNFAAIPLMTVVQIGSMLTLALSAVHDTAASAGGSAVHVAATMLVESARFKDAAPWLSVTVLPPTPWLVVSYYVAVLVAVASVRFRPHALVALTSILGILLVGIGAPRPLEDAPPGTLRVVFLDVGQGDATLVRFPDGRAYLVDAGGLPAPAIDTTEQGAAGFDVGDRVVTPTLRALRIRALDTLVFTHADPDHIGGARAVIRSFHPRAIWEGIPVPPHPARHDLVADAESAGIEWRSVQRGEHLRLASVDVRVLHPPRPDWERQRVRNDDSVVIELRYGNVSIVLPGDIGKEGETAIVPLLEPAPIVVLKSPHHGSATSSTPALLNALEPTLVIFSAGRANHFGHPAPPVVARYRAMGTTMFSTAEDGAVIVDTDGNNVRVRGWMGREVVLHAAGSGF
jgi:competence protein ComEC